MENYIISNPFDEYGILSRRFIKIFNKCNKNKLSKRFKKRSYFIVNNIINNLADFGYLSDNLSFDHIEYSNSDNIYVNLYTCLFKTLFNLEYNTNINWDFNSISFILILIKKIPTVKSKSIIIKYQTQNIYNFINRHISSELWEDEITRQMYKFTDLFTRLYITYLFKHIYVNVSYFIEYLY